MAKVEMYTVIKMYAVLIVYKITYTHSPGVLNLLVKMNIFAFAFFFCITIITACFTGTSTTHTRGATPTVVASCQSLVFNHGERYCNAKNGVQTSHKYAQAHYAGVFCNETRDPLNEVNYSFYKMYSNHSEWGSLYLYSITWNLWNADCREKTEIINSTLCEDILKKNYLSCGLS